jgi:phosphohistidine phosphatase
MSHPVPEGVRQLWILRHAKAADEGPRGRGDRDRALTDRGRHDASALGARLNAAGPRLDTPGLVVPDLALCSAAVRTTETAELVLAGLGDRVPLDAYRTLYEAGSGTALNLVREVDEHARSVMVVGHNPTMLHLAWDLLAPDSGDRRRLEDLGFPTCGLAVLALAIDSWEDLSDGCGNLLGLFAPPY